jgi:TetR/AcrR family transcriptional regulator, transcriptional repressor for nem operon
MKDTKEHILNVALELFLKSSYKGVTMQDIVTKTKLSKGAFYHYFKSKEELFLEIMNLFYNSMLIDYNKFSHESLYQFGNDYLTEMMAKFNSDNIFKDRMLYNNSNIFFLIFESIRIFPDFRKKFIKSQQNELKEWIKIVELAREKEEIKSSMTDEQIAKLFIFITDGVGMRLIIENKYDILEKEIVKLWEGLYSQIKA